MSLQLERFVTLASASVAYRPDLDSAGTSYCVGGALIAAAGDEDVVSMATQHRFPGPDKVSRALQDFPELLRLPSHRRLARMVTEVNDVLSPRAATTLVMESVAWARFVRAGADYPWALAMAASLLGSCCEVDVDPGSLRFPGPGQYAVVRRCVGDREPVAVHTIFSEFCATADDLLEQVFVYLLEGSMGIQRSCSEGEAWVLEFEPVHDDEPA